MDYHGPDKEESKWLAPDLIVRLTEERLSGTFTLNTGISRELFGPEGVSSLGLSRPFHSKCRFDIKSPQVLARRQYLKVASEY